jgi:hypothetical protein
LKNGIVFDVLIDQNAETVTFKQHYVNIKIKTYMLWYEYHLIIKWAGSNDVWVIFAKGKYLEMPYYVVLYLLNNSSKWNHWIYFLF